MPPSDLDETRLADAVRAFCGDNRGKPCSYPECRCEGYKQRIPAAIAAWEASAPKRKPATICEIEEEWTRQAKDTTGAFPFGVFLDGVRWAESRQPRAETTMMPIPQDAQTIAQTAAVIILAQEEKIAKLEAEPPRSGMTKAEREGLLLLLALRLLHYNTSMPGIREEIDAVAAAIRAETPDAE